MSFSSSNPKILETAVIANGDSGIRATVYRMRKEMTLARHDPKIHDLVDQITEGVESQSEKSQAIVSWFMENVRYVNDDNASWTEHGLKIIDIKDCPNEFQHCEPVEILNQPERLLFYHREGDCDDFSMALGVMHELAGMRVKIKIIAADPTQPREFSHVYIIVNADGKWIPIDAVNRIKPWGWELEKPFRSEVVV